MRRLALLALSITGCTFARPRPTAERQVAHDVAQRFDQVYSARHAQGLLRPRFGIPAIVEGEAPFALVTLARRDAEAPRAALVKAGLDAAQAASCLGSSATPRDACIPLELAATTSTPVEPAFALRTMAARPTTRPAVGAYDLAIEVAPGVVERAPRAVFYRAPPAADAPLTVVQLSDIHLGHDRAVEPRLAQAIRAINQLQPDVVLVTGDMAEQGRTRSLVERAGELLATIEAPVLTIIGNHDYGHFQTALPPEAPDHGFFHYARTFHPFRLFHTTVGRWELVGFDSGPSLFTPMVVTRGIDDETLRELGTALDEASRDQRNTLLFSHAPTRASLLTGTSHLGGNQIGSMHHGAAALERLLLATPRLAIHVSGHTHWSDLFYASRAPRVADRPWARVPFRTLPCAHEFTGGALLVSAPSATRISFETIEHGRSYGFVVLRLAADRSSVQFHLFDEQGRPRACPSAS